MITHATSPTDRGPASGSYDVAIVGTGLVGMTCALAAAHAGLRVALIGAAQSPQQAPLEERWDRRVYAISPANRTFLESLRVWPQLDVARVGPIRDMRVFGDGRAHEELHFAAYQVGVDALAWIVEHRELARVLTAALAFQQNIDRLDAEARAVRWEDSHIEVETDHGPVVAHLAVAADGAHSRIRNSAGLTSVERPYRQSAVVANFSVERAHGDVAWQWFTREGVVALLPLPDRGYSLVWSAPSELAAQLVALEPAALARRVDAVAAEHVGTLTPSGGASTFPLTVLRTPRQVGVRLALIGDAAHVVHPLAGQGLNLGLQDAMELTRILAARERFRDCGDKVLLRRYERARREDVWTMLQLTDGLQRLFESEQPGVPQLRTMGMGIVERIPVVKRALIRRALGA